MVNSVEVHTPEGSFLIWAEGDKPRCQAKLPDGPHDIAYWNELPQTVWPEIRQAVDKIFPRAPQSEPFLSFD